MLFRRQLQIFISLLILSIILLITLRHLLAILRIISVLALARRLLLFLSPVQQICIVLVPVVLQEAHVSGHDVQLAVEEGYFHDEDFEGQVAEDVQQEVMVLVFLTLAEVCED